MIKFETDKVDLKKVPVGSKTLFEFNFEGDNECIEEVAAGCNCTSIEVTENSIKGVYTAGKNEGSINKVINIYYKDGLELRLPKNEGNVRPHNISKAHTVLRVTGEQIVPSDSPTEK